MPSKPNAALRGPLPARRAPAAGRTRKNMDMDPEKLAAARAVLGAQSDTEAVDMALTLVLSQARILSALDGMAEDGGLEDIHATAPVPRRRRLASRAERR